MRPARTGADEDRAGRPPLDEESAEWVRSLGSEGPARDEAVVRLHALLLRIARVEVRRRGARLRIDGPELDDLAHQAAADALMAVTGKVGQFRGESRFTTWAYKFVVFEAANKVGRHYWRTPGVPFEAEDWDRLPDRLGLDPAHEAQWRDLVAALRRSVDGDLTERQRRVFVALVLEGVPLDALAAELGSTRNAVYKALFDARRKLRSVLVANGYLDDDGARRT
jgi:RNA polymerase sigma-70 factor (ECF subfamily)